MAANKKNRRFLHLLFFIVYLVLLFYFFFFADVLGRTQGEGVYRFNLTLFKEIRRFIEYYDVVGRKAFGLNIVGNIIVFIPFGYFMGVFMMPNGTWYMVTVLSFVLSLCVELTQLVVKIGSFDVDDMLLNTIGGFLGYLVFWMLRHRRRH